MGWWGALEEGVWSQWDEDVEDVAFLVARQPGLIQC